jgi:hypothetical protein
MGGGEHDGVVHDAPSVPGEMLATYAFVLDYDIVIRA